MRTLALVAALLLALTAVGAATSASPTRPAITAHSFAAVDADSGRLLVARRADVRRPIASLTKMMTGLVVIERGGLDEKIAVHPAATKVEDYREGLVPGKRYRRSTLLWSTLMVSGNDSATALGIDAGNGSLQRFYELMNAKAVALGMTRTTYTSASGLDDTWNLSTALDQAVLARAALRNGTFARIVGTRRRVVRWAAPTIAKEWINHNRMLASYPGTYGVKTGWTTKAGGCLAVAVRHGDRAVVAVILDSKAIWADMPAVVERAFAELAKGA